MNGFTNLFSGFLQEIATKGADLAIEASKHTGVFLSFYEIGNTATTILKGLFK